MLGFGALGETALGEGGDLGSYFITQDFSQPARKTGLAAAVIATTFLGFVPPPAANAAPAFSRFSEPVVRKTFIPQWLQPPLAPASVSAVFSQFGQPLISRTALPDEQPSALFEVLPPTIVPFTGFFQFGMPQFARYDFIEQSFTFFELTTTIVIRQDGGGDDRHLHDQSSRRKKRGGFEPIKKITREPIATPSRTSIPLPPFRIAPKPAFKESLPLDLVDNDLIPENLLGLRDQIRSAQENYADQQDANDIADVLAILDLDEGAT